ncbi:MAG: choice-of-anchor J domain-containing protein [Lepagella sp.]
MKKTGLLLMGLFLTATAWSATPSEAYPLPKNFDPWNLNYQIPLEKLETPQSKATAPKPRVRVNTLISREEEAETQEFFAVGQKFHKNYAFNFEGGEITTYNIGVKINGTQAVISNFFNLEAQSTSWSQGVDYDVEGVYDAEAHTITIPTSDVFSEATIAGTIGSYYTCVVLAGEVTSDGKLIPADELVFNVNEDLTVMTTGQNFGIYNYTNDGSTNYGAQCIYRKFYANIAGDQPKLIAFNNSYDLGETYPDTPKSTEFSVINVSNASADFAVTVEADDNAYTSDPATGTIDAKTVQTLNFTFRADNVGDYEGLASIDYDTEDTSAEAIQVLLFGKVKAIPDYSPVVKAGDFTFKTTLDYPFEITTVEEQTVARSTTDGRYGTSKLEVYFEVPEGNVGTFSWKGYTTNTGYWYQNAGGVFIDSTQSPAWLTETGSADISNQYEFDPGSHYVIFQYDGYYYTGDPNNGLYVYDLELVNTPAEAKAAEVETPEVNLGNYMILDENPVSGEGVIVIRNRGTESLSINNVTSSNSAITATCPSSQAGLLETVEIPVMLNASEPGRYDATITMETTAGTYTAEVTALVRKMADFSALITEGSDLVTSITTDSSYPFEITEDGVIYNANSDEADTQACTSWVQINFTVPEGKVADISWDGYCYGSSPDPEYYWAGDYATFEIKHPMNSAMTQVYGEGPADSETKFGSDEFWAPYLISVPGDHYIKFGFYKNGDGIISEKDRVEISNLKLTLRDFQEHAVEADVTDVTFDEIYVGPQRYATAIVTLKNTGSSELEVTEAVASEPFYGVIPTYNKAQFNQKLQVGLWFYPTEEGEFEGEVTFKTNAGDVVITCHGNTLSMDGILLAGDVEDEAYGWSFYDADKDGDCWNLGYNLWGENPEWVHGGKECFGSPSYSYYTGGIEPDNWLFSPQVSVPEDGAMLRWYAASHHHERYAEHYSVYAAKSEDIEDPERLAELTSLFSETLEAESHDEWVENTLDLTDYAGQDIYLCFRHHDCEGQYVLKIDDIFVYTMDKWAEMSGGSKVVDIITDGNVAKTEIYNVNGIRLRSLEDGINIVKVTYKDGRVATRKITVKK